MNWKTLSSEYLSHHIYFTARKDRCEREDGTIIDPYFVVELPTSATALAITAGNQVLLVRQYRHPIEQTILETPGGFIDPGESFETGMRRELLEETGYDFPDIRYTGRVAANPGILNNYTELFLATGGIKKQDQQLDHNEEIHIETYSLEEVIRMVKENEFIQSLHVNCIIYGLLKMNRLEFL